MASVATAPGHAAGNGWGDRGPGGRAPGVQLGIGDRSDLRW